jgi:hypothetical protein
MIPEIDELHTNSRPQNLHESQEKRSANNSAWFIDWPSFDLDEREKVQRDR